MPQQKKSLSQDEEKFFEALNDSYDALLEAIRAGTERGYRVSRKLIEQAQKAQRESVDLGKKLVEAPGDLPGFYGALVEATSKAQSRTLELAREWLGELGDAGKEARDALQQVMKANQAATRAAVEAARSRLGRARERAGKAGPKAKGAGRGEPVSPEEPESPPEATQGDSTAE
jgi:cellobiose-specific phosphotransferase system component IIA